jgi:uncharacterized protein (DUF2345 family)
VKIQLLLAFILTVLISQVESKSFEFEYQKNINVGPKAELIITNISGSIYIQGAAMDEISIQARKNVRATDLEEAEKVAGHMEINVEKNGHKIQVETHYSKLNRASKSIWNRLFGTGSDSFGTIDFEITVPYDCALDIISFAGNITITNIDSDIQLNCSAGEARLTSIEGDIKIVSAGTDIFMTSVEGSADINGTSGGLEAINYYGNIKAQTTSGDIRLHQESGYLKLSTHSGNVEVQTELDSRKDSSVKTSSGKILFAVPPTASGSVRLETVTGSINTEMPLTVSQFSKSKLSGDFGENGPRINLYSVTGNITLAQF